MPLQQQQNIVRSIWSVKQPYEPIVEVADQPGLAAMRKDIRSVFRNSGKTFPAVGFHDHIDNKSARLSLQKQSANQRL
jgi:proline dehydrogenase